MRNAVKKRVQKNKEKQRQKERQEDLELQQEMAIGVEVETEKKNKNQQQTLDVVGTEFITKYPKGSNIMFSGSRYGNEPAKTVSCEWYDKVGGPIRPRKYMVAYPPE